MELELKSINSNPELILKGELLIFEVTQLKEALNQVLETALPSTLDITAVDQCDTACSQILWSFIKTSKNRNINIQIKIEETQQKLFECCGLKLEIS